LFWGGGGGGGGGDGPSNSVQSFPCVCGTVIRIRSMQNRVQYRHLGTVMFFCAEREREREREAVRDRSTGTIYSDYWNKLKFHDQLELQMWAHVSLLMIAFMVLAQRRIVV